MAEFQDVAKAYKRLCDEFSSCIDCPLYDLVKTTSLCANSIIKFYPEEAEDIIMQWVAEHPIKTNRDKFKEVFGMDLVITGNTNKWLDQEYKGGQKWK